MRFRIAAPLALSSLLAFAPRLLAQDSTAHPSPWLFGAGMNLQGGSDARPALQLGREWRASNSRFGLRLSGEYTALGIGPRAVYDFSTSQRIGSYKADEHAIALSLLTTFALTEGRIQPYLLSGFMLQRRTGTSTFTYDDAALLAPGTLLSNEHHYTRYQSALGLEAGAGIQARVKGVWLFTEVRTQLPGLSTGNSVPEMSPRPYTFGFRF